MEDNTESASKDQRKRKLSKHKCLQPADSTPSSEVELRADDVHCDLTPGSADVWVDLPNEIKFDPAMEPFKRLYEQQHGKVETPEIVVTKDDDKEPSEKEKLELDDNGDMTTESETKERENPVKAPGPPSDDNNSKPEKKNKLQFTLRIIKLLALITCWLVLTISLIMNQEKEEVILHTAVRGGQLKQYGLESTYGRVILSITVTGPFEESVNTDSSSNVLNLWLHRESDDIGVDQTSSEWRVKINTKDGIDFSPSVVHSKTLVLEDVAAASLMNVTDISLATLENKPKVSLRMSTNIHSVLPLTISYRLSPLDEKNGIIYASILLCILYFLIIFEVVNRTLAAILSSTLAIAVLALGGERPTLEELVSWLDIETLLLLFSMMILVAFLAETGLFDYLAVVAFERTGGKTWPLINCLCFFTAFFSTFLDNVTTVLLMTPVTIRLCEVMHLNPIPVLMSMVIFSNVGGAATPVGDPPNVIIASHPAMIGKDINFTTFTLHMGVGILLVCVQTYIQLRYMFRDINQLRNSVPQDILELRQQIAVWKRAAASLSSYSRDEDLVKRALENKMKKLVASLAKREAGGGPSKTDPKFCSTIAQMKQKYRIRDTPLLIKSAICVLFVVVVFFLHAIPELQRLSLGWTAFLGALLLLLLSERDDLEPILARVEWSTLLFFAALFVLMEALSKLGLISSIGKMTETIILQVNKESRLAVALMLVLWVSGVASAFVDNIPLSTMMVRVIASLADPAGLGLPLAPLAWALSFGACLGGNGTLIGASANVVCAGVAEQHGYRFTFVQYLKIGFPIMIGNLIVASVYLLLCHVLITWH